MHAVHRTRVAHIAEEAEQLAGVARLIQYKAAEVLAKGGTLDMQQQLAFITSTFARMTKDWGVVEQLQQQGVKHKPAIDLIRKEA